MAEGDDAETQQQQRHDDVVQGVPCHHRVQGSSVNPFGYPPLSDIYKREVFVINEAFFINGEAFFMSGLPFL